MMRIRMIVQAVHVQQATKQDGTAIKHGELVVFTPAPGSDAFGTFQVNVSDPDLWETFEPGETVTFTVETG